MRHSSFTFRLLPDQLKMFLLLLIHQLLLLFSIDARSQDHGSRLVLRNSNTLCEGHLELYHKGTWGYVGDNRWRRSTEEVACRSTHCGEPLSVDQVLMPSDGLGKVWLNEMNCNGTEAHLWECPNPGWGVSRFTKDTMRWIKCSNEIKISLDEFQCEGPVKYSIGGGNQSGYFCTENFGRDEADILCKNRGCNESSEVFATDWPEGGNYDKMTIKCPDPKRLDNLWQCASPLGPGQQCLKRAAVTCTGHKRVRLVGNSDNVCSGTLQIEDRADGSWSPVMSDKTISPDVACKHMHCGTSANYSLESSGMQLNCTDSVRISLTEDCTGSVQISVNDTMHTVCPSDWTKENAEVVCAELKCGKAISSEMHIHHHNSILDNVECLGNESSLWHCRAKHRGQNNPLSCTQRVNVSCAASIGVRLVDGPGKCGGRLEIQLGSHGSKRVDSESIQAGLPRICHLLGCGPKTRNVKEKFSPGSGDFFSLAVKCGPGADNISDCIEYNVNSPLGKGEALMLTCEEHTVVSLAGENSCSGKVGIEYGDKTYWLSGSNSTWNWNSANAVCRQLHCGEAIDFSSIPSTESMNDVWKKSYNCTPDATSLFNCSNRMADHCNSTAHVTCNGSIKVDLTEGCWGHVNVCVGGKCGGVRRDTWSKQKSATLCQNLGCGTSIASAGSPDGKSKVIVESLHTTLLTANLNQSILVLSQGRHFEPLSKSSSAYVVCSGSLKSNISDSRHKCSGNVQVEVEGQWLPVCRDAIKDVETQNTICGEMKCGQAVELLDHFGPAPDSPLVISQLQWPSSDNKASSHKVTKNKKKCALAGIRCSEWKKMELKFNQSCSGAVFLHSKGRRHAVPKTNWTANEGPRLCSHLQCGNFVTVTERKPAVALWNSSINCTGVENARSIWDCEKNTAGSSSRNNSNQLVIQCEGEPRVTLSERCRGLVRIDDLNVCSDGRKLEHAHIACMEQNCGSALFVDDVPADPGTDNFLIRCESYHDRLGKCSRLRGKCTGLMYIHCAESIELKAKDQCRGQISVSYRNEWKDVCFGDFPSQSEEELCRYLDCPGGNNSLKAKRQSSKVIPSMMLNCTAEHKDVRYCVTKDTCGKNVAAIQCYKPEPEPPAGPSLVLILLCAFIPVVVLLLVVFVRVRRMRRSKKLRDAALRPLPRTEGELDSDDEDDGKSKRFESGTFSQDRFTSEVESRAEGDAHSTSSFPYDDIDEARPLTSQGATDDASDGAASEPPEHLSQGASSDAVAYEVEDPQYGYDDVGTPAPAVVQAEVHIAAGGAPEEPSTEDYLVPGRDD